MRERSVLVGVLIAASLLVGACGGGDDGVEPTATMEGEATAAADATATPQVEPTEPPTPVPPTATPEPPPPTNTPVPPSPTAESVTPVFRPDLMRCENTPTPTIDRVWQVSAPRGLPGPVRPGEVVELGLRNKFGVEGETYWAGARVIAPDGSSSVGTTMVSGNSTGYVLYPNDFPGGSPVYAGVYTVVWEIDGGYISCDGFVVEGY